MTSSGATPEVKATSLSMLTVSALGVVYGDIGTSPLYAVRECFKGEYGVPLNEGNVLGVLSLIFWALILIISVKYLIYVMRADNRGEGGILALMALVRTERSSRRRRRFLLVALGLFGAALLYGDGMITPAISVLSAVEGLRVATPLFDPYVIPITLVILVGLFAVQHRGTAGIGAVFGPITMVWFAVLSVLGVRGILLYPRVLGAISPIHAVRFFLHNGLRGTLVLGAVFLVVTGGEALYADMGHFGRRPIRIAWFGLVLPSLLVNYFGQGALLLIDPKTGENPFYRLAPGWALYPLVGLATVATIIASQAVISGAFSLTRQAVQLGYAPRTLIVHTSPGEIGQIYIPGVNWVLMLATLGLVLGFRESSNLAAAYGVAVTTTMVITTLLAFVVTRKLWGWKLAPALAVTAAFLVVDFAFFGANMIKVAHGGWFPLLVAAMVFVLMTTWSRGRELLAKRLEETSLPIRDFIPEVVRGNPPRVEGTAVFLTGAPRWAPTALLHNLKHNRVLHRRVMLLTVESQEVPHVSEQERLEIEDLGFGFYRIEINYGFMEDPDIPAVLRGTGERGVAIDPLQVTYFLSRNTVLASDRPGMAIWRERLFIWMGRNALRPTQFFHLPPNRVVELGMQIEI